MSANETPPTDRHIFGVMMRCGRGRKVADAESQGTQWDVAYETSGLEPGWYPALRCWDEEEGYFPVGAEWTGHEWMPRPISNYLHVRFDDENAAKEFAYEHDPKW